MVGVVKGVDCDYGKEEFYCIGECFFVLCCNDFVLYFIQWMWDEVYWFVIGIYCVKCVKVVGVMLLDDVLGVGVI